MEETLIASIADLQEGDEVLGTDGEWHKVELLPDQFKEMFEITFSNGKVKCSYDHLWTVFEGEDERIFSTIEIHNQIERFRGLHVGKPDGAVIQSVEGIGKGTCRCINVPSNDRQFLIYTEEGEPIFTHNCQMRIGCGQLDSIASKMAFDCNIGTTVDGRHKGAGMVKAQTVITGVQYYYAGMDWIEKWYEDRGFDKNGYPIGEVEEEIEEISLGDDYEEFSIQDEDKQFSADGIEKEVLNRRTQKFNEI